MVVGEVSFHTHVPIGFEEKFAETRFFQSAGRPPQPWAPANRPRTDPYSASDTPSPDSNGQAKFQFLGSTNRPGGSARPLSNCGNCERE